MTASLLSLLTLAACVLPVDQEHEPEERVSKPAVSVYEYSVSLLGSGETLAAGCTACSSSQYAGWLREALQVAIPLDVEYRVDITSTRVRNATIPPGSADAIARYCAMEAREPVAIHYPASCVTTEDPLLHELTAMSILDEAGNPVPEPDHGPFTYVDPATDRYQLISHQAGRVVLDLTNGPCKPVETSTPHRLFALLTVLEEASP